MDRTRRDDEPHDDRGSGRVRLGPGLSVARGVLRFKAVSASGPGGQNVNRRSTRVELRVFLADLALAPPVIERLRRIASHLVTDQDELILSAEEHRSQKRNKEACVERLGEIVRAASVRPAVRRPTKPTKGSQRRRIEDKKRRGDIKRQRRPPSSDG